MIVAEGRAVLKRCYIMDLLKVLYIGVVKSIGALADMSTKFSEDVVPLTDLKVNPGRVVNHVMESRRPVLLTNRGRGVAVVQSLSEFEAAQEDRVFMRAVMAGLSDLESGREISLAEAKARLGIE